DPSAPRLPELPPLRWERNGAGRCRRGLNGEDEGRSPGSLRWLRRRLGTSRLGPLPEPGSGDGVDSSTIAASARYDWATDLAETGETTWTMERRDVTPDERTFKRIMSRFASGVTVIAVRGAAGFHGATVNAFGSVSLVPPLVFISLESLSDTCLVVEEVGRFGVSVLGVAHEFLSERFAG